MSFGLRDVVRRALAALRANAAPGAVIVSIVIAVTLGYFYVPTVRAGLDAWQRWQEAGLSVAMLTTALAGAVLPAFVQRLLGIHQAPRVVLFFGSFLG